jgi:hypothetical protein
MNRRRFLKVFTASSATALPTSASAQQQPVVPDSGTVERLLIGFFDPLPNDPVERREVCYAAAEQVCAEPSQLREVDLDEARADASGANELFRRLDFTVQVLEDTGVTDKLDNAWIAAKRGEIGRFTQFLPLVGSAINCHAAACDVERGNPETLESFMYAVLAFGIEVALFQIQAPYKMAWSATRFVHNRTLLRLLRHACGNRCLAFAMSEFHWEVRSRIFTNVVTADNLELLVAEAESLETFAAEEVKSDDLLRSPYSVPFDEEAFRSGVEVYETIRETGSDAHEFANETVQEKRPEVERVLNESQSVAEDTLKDGQNVTKEECKKDSSVLSGFEELCKSADDSGFF